MKFIDFFALLLALLLVRILPEPNVWNQSGYAKAYRHIKTKAILKVKKLLADIDPSYRQEAREKAFVAACLEAQKAGIDTSDIRYPCAFAYLEKSF